MYRTTILHKSAKHSLIYHPSSQSIPRQLVNLVTQLVAHSCLSTLVCYKWHYYTPMLVWVHVCAPAPKSTSTKYHTRQVCTLVICKRAIQPSLLYFQPLPVLFLAPAHNQGLPGCPARFCPYGRTLTGLILSHLLMSHGQGWSRGPLKLGL